MVSINSTIEGVTGNWGPEHSRELADSLTSSNAVAIRIGVDKIGDYTLDSTGEAYQELIRCGRSLPSAGT